LFYIIGSSTANFSQNKRKHPIEEIPIVSDDHVNIEKHNLRLEVIENNIKELRNEQKSMMKMMKKIY
jgi:hypothetical protein